MSKVGFPIPSVVSERIAARSLSPRTSAALALAAFVGISFLYFGLRGQTEGGHPNLTAVAGIPLGALLVLRWVQGELRSFWLELGVGVVFGFELLVSTEVAPTMTVALLLGLVLALALVPTRRARLVQIWKPLAGAALVGAILTSPLIYYALTGFESSAQHITNEHFADLLNYFVPTRLSPVSFGWTRHLAAGFSGNVHEEGAYLGIPVLVMVALFARSTLPSTTCSPSAWPSTRGSQPRSWSRSGSPRSGRDGSGSCYRPSLSPCSYPTRPCVVRTFATST